jgi:hypothetical protein
MHGTARLVALAWLALSGSTQARAEVAPRDEAPEAPPAAGQAPGVARSSETRIAGETSSPGSSEASDPGTRARTRVGLSLVSTARGKANAHYDMATAYGVSPSVDYLVFRGLSVGVVPQILFNIKHQADPPLKQYDFMARVAYTLQVATRIALYGEGMAGYSVISPPSGDSAKGWVLGLGAGGTIDVTRRLFVNVEAGYQWGLQMISIDGIIHGDNTQFVRLALGAGMRL